MVSTIALVIATSLSVLSLGVAALALAAHWIRGKQHPDVAPVSRALNELQLSHADLVDKVAHWQRRDRTRRLRESQSDDLDSSHTPASPEIVDPKAAKAALRARVFGVKSAS